jgi:hypothetical protein
MKHNYTTPIFKGSTRSLLLLFTLFSWLLPVQAQIVLNSTSGTTSGSYSTLKAAIDNINNGTHTGGILITVHGNTTETASSVLFESGTGSSSYTVLIIRPADTATVNKTIDLGLSGSVLLELNGADNVLIDGRPLSQGSAKLLTFRHSNPNASATSGVIRLINGASFVQISHLNSSCLTTAATTASINISLSTSAATTGNRNIAIDNCLITGGVQGINMTGTLANFMDSIYIIKNTILNAQGAGVIVNAVKTLELDSNIITHNSIFSGWNVIGLNINPNVSGANYLISRNNINNLQTASAAQLLGILISPGTAGLTVAPLVNVINNNISLLATNPGITFARAMQFQGTNPAVVNCYHNTFRLGGSGAGTTGNPASMAVAKSNSSTATTFVFTNNICINTRTGAANPHIGYWNSQATAGINTTDYNTIHGPVFSAIANGFYQGTIGAYRAASLPNEQNSSFGLIDFNNNFDPIVNLNGPNTSGVKLSGTPIVSVPNDLYGTTRSTVRPYRGAFESATPIDTFDIQTVILYTFGKIPIGTDDTIRVLVRNQGTAAVTNEPINLTSTKNGYLGSVNVSLPPAGEAIINMVPYTPFILGFDTLRAYPNPDQKPSNDTSLWVRENTLNALSYSRPFVAQTGNLGTNPEGEMVAKFYTPVPNFVNQVNVNFTNNFFNGPFPFQVVIYEDSGATLGPKRVPFWVSATQNTVNGIFNLSIPSVPVSGSFYIGVRQTSANNIGFAFQNENPIRNQTFYFRQGAGFSTLAWNDFAVNPNNQFRFMIEPRLTINDDLGVVDLFAPGTGCVNLGNQAVSMQVQNLGLLNQTFATDTLRIFGRIIKPSGNTISFGPILVTSGTLAAGNTLNVTVIPSFNFDSAGAYTFTAWTRFGPDANAINDTLPPLVRNVLATSNAPIVQDFNAVTFPTTWNTNRFVISTNNGVNNTNSIRVGIDNSSPFAANAYVQSPRIGGITANSVLRFDYRILNNIGGTPATLINTDSIKIMVSTNCGNTFTQLALINGSNHVSSANLARYNVALGAYSGNDIIVKIIYDWFGTTNDVVVDMDNIRIVDGQNDVGVTLVSNPCRSIIAGSAAINPVVTIRNFGTGSQTNVPLGISITGPSTYNSTSTSGTVAASSSGVVSFLSTFNPSVAGTYTLRVWTALATDGDRSNDTLVYTFNVTNLNLGIASVNAVQFNASSSLKVKNASNLNPTGAITIEAWINRTATATWRTIVSKDSLLGFIQYSFAVNANHQLEFILNTTSGFHQFTSVDSVPPGLNHVAATFTGSNFRFYVNGNIFTDTTFTSGTIIPGNFDLTIGNEGDASTPFLGTIDELKIWNTARSANEIRLNMHTRLANTPSVNLAAYYRFDEGTGNTFTTDASGNCNTAVFSVIPPTWSANQFPLGTPAVGTQTVPFDGTFALGTTGLSVVYSGMFGTDTIYAHKFNGLPIGISPVTNPGGVTTIHPGYWMLYRYGNGTTTSTNLQFNLGTGNLNSNVNANDLRLFSRGRVNVAGWLLANNVASSAVFSSQAVTFAQTQSIYGNQLMVGANNNPLPVELLYLNAKANKLDAIVRWSTASEVNCRGFAIERSMDGTTFTEINFVKGAGNSNNTALYSYQDVDVFTKTQLVYYRLKQVDFDGSYTYSDVVNVKQEQIQTEQIAVYPNPIVNDVTVELESLKAGNAEIMITDITGKLIDKVAVEINQGFNKYTLNQTQQLTHGLYMITIVQNGQTIYNNKFVKAN